MPKKEMTGNRKEEIFNSALKCFNKKGYYKTSIDDIAAEVGITKGGIYYYFPSKKKLFIELFHDKVNSYFDKLTDYMHSKPGPAERIWQLLEQAEEDFQKNLAIYKFGLEFITVSARDREIRKEVASFYEKRVKIFTRIIEEGINAGIFKNIDPESVAWNLNFLSIGFFLTHFTTDGYFDPISQHNINLKIFFDGINKTK
jgi:AcrR family transcriptional regulator